MKGKNAESGREPPAEDTTMHIGGAGEDRNHFLVVSSDRSEDSVPDGGAR